MGGSCAQGQLSREAPDHIMVYNCDRLECALHTDRSDTV